MSVRLWETVRTLPVAYCRDEWQAGVWWRHLAFSLDDAPQLAAGTFTICDTRLALIRSILAHSVPLLK